MSLTGLQLQMQNVNTSTDFDLSTGTPASDGAGQGVITPLKHTTATKDSVRMEATLIPVNNVSGIQLLFSLNNKTYRATLPSTATGAALQKGKRYTYRVLFDEAEISLDGELSAWGEEPGDTIAPPPAPQSTMTFHIEGYSGKATVRYLSGTTETLTLDTDGKADLVTAHGGEQIRSLTLDALTTPVTLPIGRKVTDGQTFSLKVDATGKPLFRNEVSGYIPIGSRAEFQLINESANLSKKYKQEANLDLLSENWTPIGTESQSFTGEYDGGEYEITNLRVNMTTINVGLFGSINNNAMLRNIRLVSGEVTGGGRVGGICGLSGGNTSITNCHSGVTVASGGGTAGGICGRLSGSVTITACRNTGYVKSTATPINNNYNVGGIVGIIGGATVKIKDCDNSGTIEGYNYLGGIVGQCNASPADITACRNSGTIKNRGGDVAGGIVGINANNRSLTVTACYNTGVLNNTGINYTGGIIGRLEISGTLIACYNTGTVTSSNSNNIGLICGNNAGTITSCYWTKGSSSADKGVGNGTDSGTTAFGETAWPAASESGWGIGDGSAANKYWKELGGWNGGTPAYPRLWWE
jgi:hypothetical protein